MNNQHLAELSEKIRDHLTTQKARAVADVPSAPGESDIVSRCRYRGDNGTMCAVGCLIPDERYNPEIEGYSAGHANITLAMFGREEFDAMSGDFLVKLEVLLRDWQHYHDHGDYGAWVAGESWAASPAARHQRALAGRAFDVGGEA